jgi:hypothetical protein
MMLELLPLACLPAGCYVGPPPGKRSRESPVFLSSQPPHGKHLRRIIRASTMR